MEETGAGLLRLTCVWGKTTKTTAGYIRRMGIDGYGMHGWIFLDWIGSIVRVTVISR